MSAAYQIHHGPRRLSEIADAVCAERGITLAELRTHSKAQRYSRARFAVALAARRELKPDGRCVFTFREVAEFLGLSGASLITGLGRHADKEGNVSSGLMAPSLAVVPPPPSGDVEQVVFEALRYAFEREGFGKARLYAEAALKRVARQNRSAVELEGWIA